MKKIFAILFVAILMLCAVCGAESVVASQPSAATSPVSNADAAIVETAPEPSPSTPWTWQYLATIAGATAATLLIVQFLKLPLDKVWKIPTRAFVYIIAVLILTVATGFTTGLDPNTFLLCILNSFIVALAAYGAYEVTFAKLDR